MKQENKESKSFLGKGLDIVNNGIDYILDKTPWSVKAGAAIILGGLAYEFTEGKNGIVYAEEVDGKPNTEQLPPEGTDSNFEPSIDLDALFDKAESADPEEKKEMKKEGGNDDPPEGSNLTHSTRLNIETLRGDREGTTFSGRYILTEGLDEIAKLMFISSAAKKYLDEDNPSKFRENLALFSQRIGDVDYSLAFDSLRTDFKEDITSFFQGDPSLDILNRTEQTNERLEDGLKQYWGTLNIPFGEDNTHELAFAMAMRNMFTNSNIEDLTIEDGLNSLGNHLHYENNVISTIDSKDLARIIHANYTKILDDMEISGFARFANGNVSQDISTTLNGTLLPGTISSNESYKDLILGIRGTFKGDNMSGLIALYGAHGDNVQTYQEVGFEGIGAWKIDDNNVISASLGHHNSDLAAGFLFVYNKNGTNTKKALEFQKDRMEDAIALGVMSKGALMELYSLLYIDALQGNDGFAFGGRVTKEKANDRYGTDGGVDRFFGIAGIKNSHAWGITHISADDATKTVIEYGVPLTEGRNIHLFIKTSKNSIKSAGTDENYKGVQIGVQGKY